MYKNVLITGGAGFIGSKLALRLISKGYEVTVLDNLSVQIHGENPLMTSPLFQSILGKVRFLQGDVTCKSDWEKAIERQDVIVHLAAETGTGQSMYQIEHYSKVNIGGTALLLDLLTNTKNTIKKVVVASSRAIYGEGKYFSMGLGTVYPQHRSNEDMSKGDFEVKYPNCLLPLKLVATDEGSMIHPSSIYGITKQVQEQMIMTITEAIGIAGVAFRYQNVYGPGQSLSNHYTGILSIFSTRIMNGNPLNIFEDGKESRDFVYIDDAVDATVLGIEKEQANGEIFNVGTGVPTNVITIVYELMKNFGKKCPINISGNYRLGDIRHNYADLSKITLLLGFTPKVNLGEGVARFSEWVSQQKIMKEGIDSSLDELKRRGFLK